MRLRKRARTMAIPNTVSTFVRSLYKNFSPRDGDAGLTADELAAAALPLWRAAAGAKAPAGGGAHDRAADAAYTATGSVSPLPHRLKAAPCFHAMAMPFQAPIATMSTPEAAAADIALASRPCWPAMASRWSCRPAGAGNLISRPSGASSRSRCPMFCRCWKTSACISSTRSRSRFGRRTRASRSGLQEFQARPAVAGSVDLAAAGPRMEEALRQVWAGAIENDALNRLILVADLTARDVVILRTYAKFLRQSGSNFAIPTSPRPWRLSRNRASSWSGCSRPCSIRRRPATGRPRARRCAGGSWPHWKRSRTWTATASYGPSCC